MSYQLSAVCACAVASSISDVVVIRLAVGTGEALRLVKGYGERCDSVRATGNRRDWLLGYKKRDDWLKSQCSVCDWPAMFTWTRRAPSGKLRSPWCIVVATRPRPAFALKVR